MATISENITLLTIRSRERENDGLLAAFHEDVYRPDFTGDEQSDSLETWHRLLDENHSAPAHRAKVDFNVILAVGGEGKPVGGLVLMHFPRSRVTLATFLVVAKEARHNGIGKSLMGAGAALAARLCGGKDTPPMILAEAERSASAEGPGPGVAEKLEALSRLGFIAVHVPYSQPALTAKTGTVDLLLMEHFPGYIGAALSGGFDSERYRQFLREFYGYHERIPINPASLEKLLKQVEAARAEGSIRRRALTTYIEAGRDKAFGKSEGAAIGFLAFLAPGDFLHPPGKQEEFSLPRLEIPVESFRAAVRERLAKASPLMTSAADMVHSCHIDVFSRPSPVSPMPATFALTLSDAAARGGVTEAGPIPVHVQFGKSLVTHWSGSKYELIASHSGAHVFKFDFADSITVFPSGHLCYRASFMLPPKEVVPAAALIAMQSLAGSAGFTDEESSAKFRGDILFSFPADSRSQGADLRKFLSLRLQSLLASPDSALNLIIEKLAADIPERALLPTGTKPLHRKNAPAFAWDRIKATYIELVGMENHGEAAACALTLAPGPGNLRFAALLAGLAQNVLAFDMQGEAELRDSLRALNPQPLPEAQESAAFGTEATPGQSQAPGQTPARTPAQTRAKIRAELGARQEEIAYVSPGRGLFLSRESRSFRDHRNLFGGCPYRFLAMAACAYNDVLLGEASRELGKILVAPKRGPLERPHRRALRNTRLAAKSKTFGILGITSNRFHEALDDNFNLAYTLQAHFMRNVFRYELEKSVFHGYGEASAWEEQELRFEALSKTVNEVGKQLREESAAFSNEAITLVLFGLGLISLADAIPRLRHEYLESFAWSHRLDFIAGACVLLFLLLLLFILVKIFTRISGSLKDKFRG